MRIKFRWSEARGEGVMDKTDAELLLEADWVTAADFLSDVIADATKLYQEILDKKPK